MKVIRKKQFSLFSVYRCCNEGERRKLCLMPGFFQTLIFTLSNETSVEECPYFMTDIYNLPPSYQSDQFQYV